MAKFKVAVIVGSLRKDSMNLKLAKAVSKLGAGKFDTQFVQIGDLPLFSQDLEANVPAPVTRVKKEIEAADAVLFVTPEYNRGMPGPLKNAIDWASRPYGKNSFAGGDHAVGDVIEFVDHVVSSRALTPGRGFPSSHSRNAPPAVEM